MQCLVRLVSCLVSHARLGGRTFGGQVDCPCRELTRSAQAVGRGTMIKNDSEARTRTASSQCSHVLQVGKSRLSNVQWREVQLSKIFDAKERWRGGFHLHQERLYLAPTLFLQLYVSPLNGADTPHVPAMPARPKDQAESSITV